MTTAPPTTLATTPAPTTSPYDFFETCFQEYTTGVQPSDWTERWHTTVAASDVQNDASCIGGKKLRTVHSSADRYYLSWDSPSGPDFNTDNDVEVLAKVMYTNDSSIQDVRIVIHGAGATTTETGYLLDLLPTTDEIRITRFLNGAALQLGADVSMTLNADTWYWMRFRREASGNGLKGKVWPASESEPGAWSIERSDVNLDEGRTGFGSQRSTEYCDWFSVCLGGGTARGPEDIAGCTTLAPTTLAPTTLAPTTTATTVAPTTAPPTTLAPTTLAPTTTAAPTTIVTTTAPPTTSPPTTLPPTTLAPTTTAAPTTIVTTTPAPTTAPPTTLAPTTTSAPTTVAPTTIPTTAAPTTIVTTAAPTTVVPTICNRYFLSPITKEIIVDGNLCR